MVTKRAGCSTVVVVCVVVVVRVVVVRIVAVVYVATVCVVTIRVVYVRVFVTVVVVVVVVIDGDVRRTERIASTCQHCRRVVIAMIRSQGCRLQKPRVVTRRSRRCCCSSCIPFKIPVVTLAIARTIISRSIWG